VFGQPLESQQGNLHVCSSRKLEGNSPVTLSPICNLYFEAFVYRILARQSTMPRILAAGESSDRPEDPLATLDDDDELAPGEELRGMEIPIGFRLQISRPERLDDSLVGRGVLLRMGLGWFGGKIMRRAQERTRDKYDYRVMLNEDESTHSMRLPIEEYDVDENAGVGAWVLLEPDAMPVMQNQQVGVRRSGRTLTPNVRNIHQS